jgi:hypothetical protein
MNGRQPQVAELSHGSVELLLGFVRWDGSAEQESIADT